MLIKNFELTEGIFLTIAGEQVFVPMVKISNDRVIFRTDTFIS
jgi:hypothetical protein